PCKSERVAPQTSRHGQLHRDHGAVDARPWPTRRRCIRRGLQAVSMPPIPAVAAAAGVAGAVSEDCQRELTEERTFLKQINPSIAPARRYAVAGSGTSETTARLGD